MAITDKEEGVWNLDEVYNKINAEGIWDYDGATGLFVSGTNYYGNLGLNTNEDRRSSPTQIPGTEWNTLTEGMQPYSMGAIKSSDNSLWLWGRNHKGQLGQNNNVDRSSPVRVPGQWSNVTQGADNDYVCLGVKVDGTLWAWGEGCNATGLESPTQKSSPVQVGSDTTWKEVSMGADYTLATKTDGTLWTMGDNLYGRMGMNNNSGYQSPKQIGSDTNWAFAKAGRPGNSIATKTDGTLWTWGLVANGGVDQNKGSWSQTNYSSPRQVGSSTDWDYSHGSKIEAALYRMFAIKTDGTLWACGAGSQGQLGQNNTTSYSSPMQIPGTTWEAISSSYYCTIGSKTDGTLWTWGNNGNGALGHNAPVNTHLSSPTQLPGTWAYGDRKMRSGFYTFAGIKEL